MKLLRMECWGLISRFSIHRIEETMWFSHKNKALLFWHMGCLHLLYTIFSYILLCKTQALAKSCFSVNNIEPSMQKLNCFKYLIVQIILTKLAIDTLFFQGSTASQNDYISVYYDIVFCFDNSLGSDWHQKMWVSIFIIVVL